MASRTAACPKCGKKYRVEWPDGSTGNNHVCLYCRNVVEGKLCNTMVDDLHLREGDTATLTEI